MKIDPTCLQKFQQLRFIEMENFYKYFHLIYLSLAILTPL